MIMYFSGSIFSGGHPENLKDPVNIMMSYYEIKKNVAKQQARFRAILERRTQDSKKKRTGS